MIRQPTRITTRDVISDNITYTLGELHKQDSRWKFSHTKGAYNYYVLETQDKATQ